MKTRTSKKALKVLGVVCAVGAAAALRPPPASGQTNLLTDPGFEVSQGNYDASGGDVYGAVGWTAFNTGAYTTFTIAFDGEQSFKTFGQFNGIYQQFTVTPGESFTASVWAIDSSLDPMGTGTVGSLELNFYQNAAGTGNADFNVTPVVTGGTSPMDTWIQASETEIVPAGFNTMRIQINQTSAAPSGATYYDDASLIQNAGYQGPPLWSLNASGDWNVAANWNGAVPNAPGAAADFLGAVNPGGTVTGTANNTTVFTDLPITAGTIHFSNANTYEITGTGNLTLQGLTGSNALVQVDSGKQELDLPVTVASNTTFNVASGATLLVANPLTVDAGDKVIQTGSGTVTYQSIVTLGTGSSLSIGNPTIGNLLNVGASAKVSLTASTGAPHSVQFNGITLAGGASMDVTNNTFTVNYAGGADPAASIASALAAGFSSQWNGAGIYSSTVASLNASQSALIYSVGYADGSDGITSVPSSEIEILPTLAGDAKLQGNVVFGDFQLLSQYFGQSNTTWDEGNFTYGSTTNFGDFQLLSQNFGASASALTAGELASLNGFAAEFGEGVVPNAGGGFSVVAVPEPASMGLMLVGVGVLARRKQRRTDR